MQAFMYKHPLGNVWNRPVVLVLQLKGVQLSFHHFSGPAALYGIVGSHLGRELLKAGVILADKAPVVHSGTLDVQGHDLLE